MNHFFLALAIITASLPAAAAPPETLKVRALSWDIGFRPETQDAWMDRVERELDRALTARAQVVVFPELFGWGLAPYAPTGSPAAAHVTRAWNEVLLPRLARRLRDSDAFVVLGSYPHLDPGADAILNRASVWHDGAWRNADKTHPTPAEAFDEKPPTRAGETIPLFRVFGGTAAVVICYSIEMPEVAAALKKAGVQLLAVPSATSDSAGLGRVRRSTSARAVELGAAVVLAGLTGSQQTWRNLGGPALYLPAQKAIARPVRQSRARRRGFDHRDAVVPWRTLLELRSNPAPRETRPFLTPGEGFRLKTRPED